MINYNNLYTVGTKLKVINGGFGAHGADGGVGIVTLDEPTNGLLEEDDGFNLQMKNSHEIWRVSFDGEYEIISK